ncbi:MAG: winged helix DNA-binding domain-containing protein [Aeromicrobium erythreum]
MSGAKASGSRPWPRPAKWSWRRSATLRGAPATTSPPAWTTQGRRSAATSWPTSSWPPSSAARWPDAATPGGPHRYRPLDLAPSTAGVDAERAWLAATYARGHGPFTPADLAWWSSLTLTQARRAVADAGLHEVELGGRRLWSPHPQDELRDHRVDVPAALLLSQFDELVSYARDADLRTEVGAGYTATMSGAGLLVLDGRLAGHWSRSVRASTLTVVVHTDATLSRGHRSSLHHEAAALATFHGLSDVVVSVV